MTYKEQSWLRTSSLEDLLSRKASLTNQKEACTTIYPALSYSRSRSPAQELANTRASARVSVDEEAVTRAPACTLSGGKQVACAPSPRVGCAVHRSELADGLYLASVCHHKAELLQRIKLVYVLRYARLGFVWATHNRQGGTDNLLAAARRRQT